MTQQRRGRRLKKTSQAEELNDDELNFYDEPINDDKFNFYDDCGNDYIESLLAQVGHLPMEGIETILYWLRKQTCFIESDYVTEYLSLDDSAGFWVDALHNILQVVINYLEVDRNLDVDRSLEEWSKRELYLITLYCNKPKGFYILSKELRRTKESMIVKLKELNIEFDKQRLLEVPSLDDKTLEDKNEYYNEYFKEDAFLL